MVLGRWEERLIRAGGVICDKHIENGTLKLKRDDAGVIRENLVIKGNNLIVLHTLKEQFRGRVKLIYIDPPYNTGGSSETFTYNNAFNHSTWLTFMKNRLEVARELLTPDGFIAIAIDHHELFYLGALVDEIFGRENKLGVITVVHKPEGRSQEKFFGTSNEFMLVYARDRSLANFRKVLISEGKKANFNLEDENGKYKLRSFIRGEELRRNKPDNFYPIYVSSNLDDISLIEEKNYHKILPINNGVERIWFLKPKSFLKKVRRDEIVAQKNQKDEIRIFYKVREVEVFTTHWIAKKYNAVSHGTKLLEKIIGRKSVSYPKSLYTVLDIIKITTDPGDIVLDFFAGSGTTGHAVLELNKHDSGNRQFILVEQLEKHIAVCKERLRKVIEKEKLLGENFISCELMPYNQVFMERIQFATTSAELLDIWRDMAEDSALNWYITPDAPEGAEAHFSAIKDVEQQKRLLAELLDKNQLYVHLSEIEDETFQVSEADKTLNRVFYSKPL